MPHPLTLGVLSLFLITATTDDPPQEVEPPVTASIEDFAWLAGHWRGQGLGGACEEVWSSPMAGTMVGTFRLVQDGEVSFYEIMVLGRDDWGWSLRVKHFSKDFVGWEDQEGAVRFALESVEPGAAKFSGLTIRRNGDDLHLELRMRSRDGSTRWEPLEMRRTPPDAG